MRTITLLIAALAVTFPLPVPAQTGGQVICDIKVMRLVHTLKDKADGMTAQELDTARRALYKAISECRPLRLSHDTRAGGAQLAEDSDKRKATEAVEQNRRDLRMQQNVLTKPELREGERRLDAIQHKAQTDPYAARQMEQQYRLDQSLSTVNRPIPGPSSPKDNR